jgi:hypothetical protein
MKLPDVVPHSPSLRRLRQEDHKFEANLGFMARLFQKNKTIVTKKPTNQTNKIQVLPNYETIQMI